MQEGMDAVKQERQALYTLLAEEKEKCFEEERQAAQVCQTSAMSKRTKKNQPSALSVKTLPTSTSNRERISMSQMRLQKILRWSSGRWQLTRGEHGLFKLDALAALAKGCFQSKTGC